MEWTKLIQDSYNEHCDDAVLSIKEKIPRV